MEVTKLVTEKITSEFEGPKPELIKLQRRLVRFYGYLKPGAYEHEGKKIKIVEQGIAKSLNSTFADESEETLCIICSSLYTGIDFRANSRSYFPGQILEAKIQITQDQVLMFVYTPNNSIDLVIDPLNLDQQELHLNGQQITKDLEHLFARFGLKFDEDGVDNK